MLYTNSNYLVQLQNDILDANVPLKYLYLKMYCVPCGREFIIGD